MPEPAAAPAAGPREYLDRLAFHGIKLGLDNIRVLLERLYNPQERFPALHIGGTNGKGSVTAFLQGMLRAAGYRTGRFTSPHLIDVNERFQVDGAPIPDAALDALIARVREAAAALPHPPTYFEVNTAIAFAWFAAQAVDIAVVEVGMGGRLDSTNVILPLAAAITNIDFEHTAYLGDTLEAIAGEKSGILKPGVPAVAGAMPDGPLGVIEAQARAAGCTLWRSGRDFRHACRGGPWDLRLDYAGPGVRIEDAPLGLAGWHQAGNAAIALAVAETVCSKLPALDAGAMRDGLAEARWPGRLERVLDDPPVIIDVAHNAAGARELARAVRPCAAIFAVSSDKDARAMLEILAGACPKFILTEFAGKRSLGLEALSAAAHGLVDAVPAANMAEALEMGICAARAGGGPLLITGSIYAAGEARRLLTSAYGAPPPRF